MVLKCQSERVRKEGQEEVSLPTSFPTVLDRTTQSPLLKRTPRISLPARCPAPGEKENGGSQVCVAIETFFNLENGE